MARRKAHQALQVGPRHFRGHAPALAGKEQRHEVKNRELGGETLGRGNRNLRSRAGDQSRAGFAHDRGVRDIRDGDGLDASRESLALGRERIGRLSGLRDHHNDRFHGGMGRAVAIFAGIFDIHRHARQVLDHDFAGQACVTARSAGRDDQLFKSKERARNGLQFAGKNNVVLEMFFDRLRNGRGLFIDLAAHGMGKFAMRFSKSERFG